jgi:hypothetical protein
MNDAMGVHFNSPERSRTGKKASVALPDNEDLAFTVVVRAFVVPNLLLSRSFSSFHLPRPACCVCILRSKCLLLLLLLWLLLMLLLLLLLFLLLFLLLLILLREQAKQ